MAELLVLRRDTTAGTERYVCATESLDTLYQRLSWLNGELIPPYAWLLADPPPTLEYATPTLHNVNGCPLTTTATRLFKPTLINRLTGQPRPSPLAVFDAATGSRLGGHESIRAAQRADPGLGNFHGLVTRLAWGAHAYRGRVYLFTPNYEP
jgi:hypothetical protein